MIKRGGSLFSGSKKGMSPLIATVLLIAFAVAMGAMIMNWSSTLGESITGMDCSGINLALNPGICYRDNLIKISLRNDGKDIEQVTVRIVDDLTQNEVNLKDSRLRTGDTLEKSIPFIKNSVTTIGIIPSINKDGLVVNCPAPVLEIPDVAECTS